MNSLKAFDVFRSAISILFREGPTELSYQGCMKLKPMTFERSSLWGKLLRVVLILMYQLHLILDEKAIAYPIEKYKWQIVSLPRMRKERQLPTLDPAGGYRHGSNNHQKIMKTIYSFPGFVSIEPEDVVVDVGAYVGGFSMFGADTAECVIAIEPTAAVNNILQHNLREYQNIEIVPKAAWNSNDILKINQSHHPSENSILTVDAQETNDSFLIQAETVPDIVRSIGYQSIDFLKIEAEGVEPEILEGALEDEMKINKIAVDTSAERDGEKCSDEVISLLECYGYEWRRKNQEIRWGEDIIFAKKV